VTRARLGLGLGVSASLALAACGPLIELPGSGPAPDHVALTALTNNVETKTDEFILIVDEPTMPGELIGADIAIKSPGGHRVNYLDGARWTSRTPLILHRYLIASFDNAAPWHTIGGGSLLEIPADYRLKLDVRDFHAELNGAPNVFVTIAAKLVRNGPVELIDARQFKTRADAASRSPADLARAFDTAMDEVSRKMIDWVEQAVPRD